MVLRPTEHAGVYTDGSWFYTRNLVPGIAVYGERLLVEGGIEYRRWDATRSKLAAYLKRGGRVWPFEPTSRILYLGAGSGTTVSHLSDVCPRGFLLAVEVSPRAFRDLLTIVERRPNVVPLLADARKPETYRSHAGLVDVLYQDVAQRDQVAIFRRNLDFLRGGGIGYLMMKARSADVAAKPSTVYREARRSLALVGLDLLDFRDLRPFEKDHAALVVRKPSDSVGEGRGPSGSEENRFNQS